MSNTYHVLGVVHRGDAKDHPNIIYCCYRHGFPQIEGFTDDVGWGCTVRSYQMLVANAVQKFTKDDKFAKTLVTDNNNSPFSLQSIVRQGRIHCSRGAGEWFKPSECARCISFIFSKAVLNQVGFNFFIYGIDKPEAMFFPSLFVFPCKLGIDTIDPSYHPMFFDMLRHPKNMGIVGGCGFSSYYLVGISHDDKILYLDPHDVRTFHDHNYLHRKLGSISIDLLNPSVALAFFVDNVHEFKEIESTYSKIFSTADSGDLIDIDKYTCLDGDDDDFCVIVENGET